MGAFFKAPKGAYPCIYTNRNNYCEKKQAQSQVVSTFISTFTLIVFFIEKDLTSCYTCNCLENKITRGGLCVLIFYRNINIKYVNSIV